MALDATKVRVAVTGAVYADLTGAAAAPTTVSSVLTTWVDLGYVSEDGVTLTFPDSGDATNLKAWQGGATVRVIRSPSEDAPTVQVKLIETNPSVIKAVFGGVLTQTATDGSFIFDQNAARVKLPLIIDVVDGAELMRVHAPQAIVTSIGDLSLTSDDAIGWEITLDCERSATVNYNLKTWMTALKT